MEDLVVINKEKSKNLIETIGSDLYSEFIRLSNNDNLILTQDNYKFLKNKIVEIENIDLGANMNGRRSIKNSLCDQSLT